MKLLDIQEQKIEQVVELLSEDRFNNKKPLYFQSPTGSGKTKMLARIIEEYKISNPTDKFLFIVASISTGGIEKQNYFSLKECERNGFNFKVEHISSGLTQPIKPSYLTDVLTIGEASFKNKSLLFEDHLLEEYLQKVYDSNKKIIFIRDEAHIGTKIGKEDSQNLSRLNKYFDKILYLSATLENFQDKIKVREAVEMTLIEAQENKLIKNYVILNNDGQINKTINEKQLFEYGCDKLNYLKTNVYPIFSKKLDRVFNPALLVQISNVEQGENQIKEIVEVCEKKNLTYAFALDKSGDSFQASGTMYKNKKIKREDLQKNDSDIDVIIFKYSVATGWNIPRATILCQYRNVIKENLHIQTLGRVMRNIFIAKNDLLEELTLDEQKMALTCWLYSFHESAKKFESFTLTLKEELKNETIFFTKEVKGHNKEKKEIGYVGKYKNEMISDIYDFFINVYSNIDIKSLLDANLKLKIIVNKTIKYGDITIDDDLTESSKMNIKQVIKEISNQIELDKEFWYWIERTSPALKSIMEGVLIKIDNHQKCVLFKILTIKENEFNKEIIAIKRKYQTKWEKDPNHWKENFILDEMKLPIEQKGSESSKMPIMEIEHLLPYFTFSLFDDQTDLFVGPETEKDFLKKLDSFLEYNDDFIKYVHRNLPGINGIYYTYNDSNTNTFKKSYPDFIIKTIKGTTIICEVKSDWDIDPNRTKSIENGYKANSLEFKQFGKYFFGLFKNKNGKFHMSIYTNGKKVAKEIEFLKQWEKEISGFTDLKVLFKIVGLWEKENKV